jgi:transcriptional regulator with XRE-family HTH domain
VAPTQQQLGERVRAAREGGALTQGQLGQLCGLSRLALGQIGSGSRAISSLELERLSVALGLDMRSFFADEFSERDALTVLGRELANLEHLLGIDRSHLLAQASDLTVSSTQRGFLSLAIEAYRREEITHRKLRELASLVCDARADVDALLATVAAQCR